MEFIKACRSCNSDDITEFFDLGKQPFANALTTSNQQGHERLYPLSLSWCQQCSLVQLNQTADPKELFANYVWVTGTSSTAINYAESFSALVLQGITKNNNFILEIASNDGTFLKSFQKKGCQVLGVDPAENIVKIANEKQVPTICHFFGQTVAHSIIEEHSFPDFIVVRNVLPHVANLHDFVQGLAYCMNEQNTLIIEFHYAKIILEELHYDSIYHEHLCYFSIRSISHLLAQYGLYICDLKQSPISGGSLVAFVKKGHQNPSQEVVNLLENEVRENINSLSSWQNFAHQAETHRQKFLTLLNKEKELGNTMIGYGASARSSTFLNYCGITKEHLLAIADQNPIKLGFLAPGTEIPILTPEDALKMTPDTIVVLAWNFFEEIVEILKLRFHFKGSLIKLFPQPEKIALEK